MNARPLTIRPSAFALAPAVIAAMLRRYIGQNSFNVLCIGSDRVTGDCLGPLVGHYLKTRYRSPLAVFGCLEMPVTALNLTSVLATLSRRYASRMTIAVDSAIGAPSLVGCIKLAPESIAPGSADGKALPRVGDVAITGIVSGLPPSLSLAAASIKLGSVNRLAEVIAEGIDQFAQTLNNSTATLPLYTTIFK